MKKLIFSFFLFSHFPAHGQLDIQLTPKVFIGVHENIEIYFFAEKLAVEHIDHFVFNNRNMDYMHQPIVYHAFQYFRKYKDAPVIIRISEIIEQLRDSLHDNGPIMDYLINQPELSSKTESASVAGQQGNQIINATKYLPLMQELTDSLRSFYIQTDANTFLKENIAFYKGALQEFIADVDGDIFSFMEQYYGKTFPKYQLYISPAMPIPSGEDNYRGYGPQISTPNGLVPTMIVSSSKMLPLQDSLSLYRHYGFDNRQVTQFIYSHEIGHSFINPLLEKYASQIKRDSILYTEELKALLSPRYINDWYVCVVEHLVRLGEIRIAVMMENEEEASRLRKLHIGQYKCVLIPFLENEIQKYELNRSRYPTFESFLGDLIDSLHTLTPQAINDEVSKYKDKF
ncbi:DUF4932 domain-containing protein [Olivibacter sitiensis]|uniref:DUF4932 domain-containing protein n=1 Tax=Olivibacter sitiensis TaxID=376470 RepID=UPI0003FD0672|nr:DUF4932 domain-containing protein [Olivibacter sitiensis]